MKHVLVPGLLALLAACGTPQENCINAATRDMRVVDGLIAETEGNLARGYAYKEVTTFSQQFQDCTPRPTVANPDPAPVQCLVQVPVTSREPMAIDLGAESAKLASLQAKRSAQSKAAEPAIAQCRAVHPE